LSDNHIILNQSPDRRSNSLFLCSMRISFGLIIVLLIILIIISGLLYVMDLLVQSSCRLVHSDQSRLVSFVSGRKIRLKKKEFVF
jgi:hypothetical protein